jgi:membrane protein YqaA with SNARE-associated domain
VGDLLGVLGVGILSALVPLVNIEAYLGVRGAVADQPGVWVVGLVAAVGQMLGKVVWYYLGATALDWRWVRRRIESPRAQRRLEVWRSRVSERPLLAAVATFASALAGVPPFAILAVLAGQLRMSLALFLGLGVVGRWLRFTAVLGGAAWLGAVVR